MCGIFGIMWHRTDAVPDRERLDVTAGLLEHRGPDGQGIYAEKGVGLVHRRLCLLDLSERSNQPFWDREQRFALLYNGEIYNFVELREALLRAGVQFRTTGDTEVLLEALLKWGSGATLPRLEGMFAFALYDRCEQTFLVARDRFGIKPLFISETADAFVVASELTAMRPWLRFEPDLLSISSFLHGFAGPHRGHTFLANVKILNPGTFTCVRRGKPAAVESRSFFSLADFVDSQQQTALARTSDSKLVDLVDEQLQAVVKAQLIADVPVGALCSGGLDSSLIMAIAARYHTNLAVFHANVLGPFSEVEAAATLARHLHLDLKTVTVSDDDFVERIPQVVRHYGHPFYPNPHAIPFLMVSELIRASGVKAVLSGEGADECYLGYPWLAPDVRQWRTLVRGQVRTLLRKLSKAPQRHHERARYWGPSWEAAVHPEGFRGHQHALVTALHNRFEVVGEADLIRQRLKSSDISNASALMSLDLLHYNLRTLLHRNDAMGMAASVESRFPFLDSAFVRLAVNMPQRAKIRFSPWYRDSRHDFFKDKWLLRTIAERYLPRQISDRQKLGFPVDAPQRMEIAPDLFEKSHVAALFGIPATSMRYLIEQAGQPLKLRLMQLEVWAAIFVHDESDADILSRLTSSVRIRPFEHRAPAT